MLILAFDTTGPVLTVALWEDGTLLAEYSRRTVRTHARDLLPAIDRLYQEADRPPTSTGAVGVSRGPGSFTGIRIGLSTAQSLAVAWNRPVFGVSSLSVLAANMAGFPGPVLAILDARRRDLYMGEYRLRDGFPVQQGETRALSLEELAKEIRGFKEQVALVGDGAIRHREFFRELGEAALLPPEEFHWPRAFAVARLAAYYLEGGESGDPLSLAPFYLRPPQVER